MMMILLLCPACRLRDRGRNKYLCYECWHELPLPARRALGRADKQAFARLRQLYDQINDGTPLHQITITP